MKIACPAAANRGRIIRRRRFVRGSSRARMRSRNNGSLLLRRHKRNRATSNRALLLHRNRGTSSHAPLLRRSRVGNLSHGPRRSCIRSRAWSCHVHLRSIRPLRHAANRASGQTPVRQEATSFSKNSSGRPLRPPHFFL